MKRFLSMLFLCLVLSDAQSQKLPWIKFNWVGDSINNRYYDKLAMTVPLRVDGMPYKFDAQLDLGAVNTMLYGNVIQPYLEESKTLKQKIDTTSKVWIQGQKNPTIKGIDLKLDQILFRNLDVALFEGFGDTLTIDSVKTKTVKHVGTIAPDLFQNKVLIIDYPRKRFCVVNELPKKYSKANFVDFILKDGRIKVPFTINDQEEYLLFDTGSSLFTLFTSEDNIKDVSGQSMAVSDSIEISTWGNYYYVYGKETVTNVKLGNKLMPTTTAFYTTLEDMTSFFTEEEIWGVTGNAYFLNDTIIIDYKNNRFGIE